MILACCDIGNTRIKIGIFLNDDLISFISFLSIQETAKYLKESNPDVIAVSSVVPRGAAGLIDFCHNEMGRDPFIVDRSKKLRLQIDYDTPESLGIDRICTSEGAFKLCTNQNALTENEVIVVADLGTASTFNIIQYPNRFTGGLIAPGPGLLFKGLQLYTAQLPEVSLDDFSGLIGRDTKSCIANGVKNSITGLLERVYNKLSEDNRIIRFFLTGGNAAAFLNEINFEYDHQPELLISGIKSIYDYNTSK